MIAMSSLEDLCQVESVWTVSRSKVLISSVPGVVGHTPARGLSSIEVNHVGLLELLLPLSISSVSPELLNANSIDRVE